MRAKCICPLVVAALQVVAAAAHAQATFSYDLVGGVVSAADNKTVIVSVPAQGKLHFIDTIAGKEIKTVDLDFQPAALAVQGKHLFATTKGTAKVSVLDAESGKVTKTIALPGDPVDNLGCHPAKGLLYAVNQKYEVFSVDIEKGTFQKTKGRGHMLVVDSGEGKYVYTGIQKPIQDVLIVEDLGGDKFKISSAQANTRALMLKYAIDGENLKLVAANDNAAVNGRAMAVSPDGKLVAMAGGGGWRSLNSPKANYAIAFFDTAKMKDVSGQFETGPYPNNIAFHPVLDLGAAYNSKEVILFNTKSYVKKEAFKATGKNFNHPGYMLFSGHGTKVVFCSHFGATKKSSVLQIFNVPIDAKDQERLDKVYPPQKK